MAIDNIDVCQLLKGMNSIPLVAFYRDFFFELMPKLPRSCPFKKGKYNTYNISFVNEVTGSGVESFISPTELPNGIYKNTLRFFNDKDKIGVCFWFHVEKYYVKNAENALRK